MGVQRKWQPFNDAVQISVGLSLGVATSTSFVRSGTIAHLTEAPLGEIKDHLFDLNNGSRPNLEHEGVIAAWNNGSASSTSEKLVSDPTHAVALS